MKKIFLFIILWFVVSCTPKPKMIKVVSSYQYGLEITESLDLIDNLVPIGKFCLKNNTGNIENQLLVPTGRYKYIHHSYKLEDVIEWLNKLNKCNENSPVVYLNSVDSKRTYIRRMRYNGHTTYITLGANYFCNQKNVRYFSTKDRGLEKLGFIGEKKTQAMMSATVILAFHAVIADIYNQINTKCK